MFTLFPPGNALILAHILSLKQEIRKLMTDQNETAAALVAVKEQLVKASAEIVAKITALEAAVAAAGGSTPAVDAAVADLKDVAQVLDNIGDPTV